MDPNQALFYSQMVGEAYALAPAAAPIAPGTVLPGAYVNPGPFTIEATIFGSDLANDLNLLRGAQTVTYGMVIRDDANNVIVAIRGTEGVYEWLHDFYFLYSPFPFVPGAGKTEDGFTTIYESMRIGPAVGTARLHDHLIASHAANPMNSLTICGHSLGGALATLLALEVGVTASKIPTMPQPVAYTYASPRVGDTDFVNLYNHVVTANYRFANRADLVPKLPLPPMYEHVNGLIDLNPSGSGAPPTTLVNFSISCEHILSSYQFLLSQTPGVTPQNQTAFPLSGACRPAHGAGAPVLGQALPGVPV